MKGKESSPVYVEGEEVQVNVGPSITPEWLNGKVTNLSPVTEDRLLKAIEKVFRFEPVIVVVDEDSSTLAGAEVTVYKSNTSRVRPRSHE